MVVKRLETRSGLNVEAGFAKSSHLPTRLGPPVRGFWHLLNFPIGDNTSEKLVRRKHVVTAERSKLRDEIVDAEDSLRVSD